jgi:CBS domain-containing protein
MNQRNTNHVKTARNPREEVFFVTELIGARAYLRDRKIGRLKDIVAVDRGKLGEVTHVQIARPFGEPSLLVPLANVRSLTPREIVVDIEGLETYVRQLSTDEVLLKDYLLDKKVLDVEDREVEVVYDMRLVLTGDRVYVSDVDISHYGLLRRLGLKGVANHLYKRAAETRKQLIPWSYIEPLPAQLGTLQGNVKLSVLKETLADIHPVDLADILEELDSAQRVTLLEGLDTEQASDTLEEIDPAVQRDIVFSLRKERVAQLIADMTPGQAADVVSVLPAEEKRNILKLLEPGQVAKIEEILEKQDVNILNFTTPNFFKCVPDTTVEQAREKFRAAAREMDVVMYFYIVNEADKLLGVLDIKEVFMADDSRLLRDLMIENVISLNPDSTMKQAANMFVRYGFRALPVTDEDEMILGVVPYRDVMQLKHRILE